MIRAATTGIVAIMVLAGCGAPADQATPATSGAPPTPTSSPSLAFTLTPSPTASQEPASVDAPSLPVRDAVDVLSVRITPASAGLFVSLPTREGEVLMLLDASGRPRPGWPLRLAGQHACLAPVTAEDGSIRLVCALEWEGPNVAFAFDPSGRPIDGWPVVFPGTIGANGAPRVAPRVVGDRLVVAVWQAYAEEEPFKAESWLVAIAPDGGLVTGARLQHGCCGGGTWLAPDGRGFVTDYTRLETHVTAFTLDGPSSGWPATIGGFASAPGVGPDGSVSIVVGSPNESPSKVAGFDAAGNDLPESGELPIASTSHWVGAGEETGWPVVADDGTVFVVQAAPRAVVYALDPERRRMPGWPYRASVELEQLGDWSCGPGDVGCGYWRASPVPGTDGVLYMLLSSRDSRSGGSIVAVGRDGQIRPGWPVTLRRPGAIFSTVVIDDQGIAYTVAVEQESNGLSATILAVAPGGAVRWTTTIAEP